MPRRIKIRHIKRIRGLLICKSLKSGARRPALDRFSTTFSRMPYETKAICYKSDISCFAFQMHTKHVKTEHKKGVVGLGERRMCGSTTLVLSFKRRFRYERALSRKNQKNKEAIEDGTDAYEFLLYNRETKLIRLLFCLFPGGFETSQGCGTGYRGTWSF